mmetsp:Transcript_31070/g.91233  ORF Transcript_31070/g.91233 Transcript_31070/m.91233 type:complete len:309 (-) Transcript_31070:730-1656(-)
MSTSLLHLVSSTRSTRMPAAIDRLEMKPPMRQPSVWFSLRQPRAHSWPPSPPNHADVVTLSRLTGGRRSFVLSSDPPPLPCVSSGVSKAASSTLVAPSAVTTNTPPSSSSSSSPAAPPAAATAAASGAAAAAGAPRRLSFDYGRPAHPRRAWRHGGLQRQAPRSLQRAVGAQPERQPAARARQLPHAPLEANRPRQLGPRRVPHRAHRAARPADPSLLSLVRPAPCDHDRGVHGALLPRRAREQQQPARARGGRPAVGRRERARGTVEEDAHAHRRPLARGLQVDQRRASLGPAPHASRGHAHLRRRP